MSALRRPSQSIVSLLAKRLPGLLQLLTVLLAVCASAQLACAEPRSARGEAAELLNQARTEKDPKKRIELLDTALQNQNLRGELLSSILFERGMAHKQMKDCFRAVEDFSSALAHSRRALSARLESAECLIELDQYDEASREVEYYLLSKPGDPRAYVLKGMIYEKAGFLSKAEDEYTRALHYDPQSRLALAARSKVLLKAGKPRQALEDANMLSGLDPRNPEVFGMRARIYVKLKDYEAALKDYDKLETMVPGNSRIRKEKVLVYFEAGQPDNAHETLSTLSRQAEDDPEILVLQARAHLLLKNYEKAEKTLNRALMKWPHNAAVYLLSGMVLARRGQPDEALAHLNRALELDPALVEAHKERAKIFSELGDPVRAASDLTEAANLDPSDGEIFATRGLSLMKRMLYSAAIKDFSRALENLPDDPWILYDRAVAYMRIDEPQLALDDLNLVLQKRPDAARATSLRGVAHFTMGNLNEARADLIKASTMDSKDPRLWNNLAFFSYKTGDHKSALDAINRALQLDPEYEKARDNLRLLMERETTPAGSAPGRAPNGEPGTRADIAPDAGSRSDR